MSENASIAASLQQRQLAKAAQTLLGICAGITCDSKINDLEIAYLRTWLADHPDVAAVWPGSAIARRIDEILADGIVTDEERTDLFSILKNLSGNQFAETGSAEPAGPAIPFDDDPSIFFRNMTFCFTGQFYYGTRAACERVILKLQAMAVDNVSGKLDYLVVGSAVSPDWVNSTYGRKIETAIQRQERYGQPAIISETQWIAAIQAATITPQ